MLSYPCQLIPRGRFDKLIPIAIGPHFCQDFSQDFVGNYNRYRLISYISRGLVARQALNHSSVFIVKIYCLSCSQKLKCLTRHAAHCSLLYATLAAWHPPGFTIASIILMHFPCSGQPQKIYHGSTLLAFDETIDDQWKKSRTLSCT